MAREKQSAKDLVLDVETGFLVVVEGMLRVFRGIQCCLNVS